MSKWIKAVAITAALVVGAVASPDAWRAADAVRSDVEVVAAGNGWRCSSGGPVVSGGDLSGYACEGEGGRGTMEPLSMVGYVRGADDWAFGEAESDDWAGLLARVKFGGVQIIIDAENAGACFAGRDGNYHCHVLSKQARDVVLEAGEEIAADIRARFNALKK